MNKNQLITFAFLLFRIATAQAQVSAASNNAQKALTTIDHRYFIENKGQWPSEVLYLTQMGGLNTWITTKGMLYEFYKTEEIKDASTPYDIPDKFEQKEYKRWGHRVGYKLIGNNALVNTEGKQKQEGYYNYLIGNDLSKHANNVGLYKEAVVKNVYNGIDMRYYFDKGLLRYDYVVHPGADPTQIHFSLEGSQKTYLNNKGELIFTTCFGEVKNTDLYSYQQQDKKPITSQFKKQGGSYFFALGTYNKSQTLIIDPLIYSTYIGGGNNDYGYDITLDAANNAYITGYSYSADYDTTVGAFQITKEGIYDALVTKLNSSGTGLIFSTYIGGNGSEQGYSIALDASNNTYITGYTSSSNYDISSGAFQTILGGSLDVFVSKLNASGTALIYSTYIGGSNDDEGRSIALDNSGNVYIAGYSESIDFDITPGAFQTTNPDSTDEVFVSKLNAFGTALIYSTYIGGSNTDRGNSIAIDLAGNAYITGWTSSADYDITTGAYQTTNPGGGLDVFVSKLNISGSSLIYSTYIGGSSSDYGRSLALDAAGNTYITGGTISANFDTTLGAFQTTFGGGSNDAFVSKLNAAGSALIYSTYLGGSYPDFAYSIAVDNFDNAFITGYTNSIDFDTTAGAFQTTNGGSDDVFVTKLNSMGTALMYSTYIGGNGNDVGFGLTIDGSGKPYITGFTRSTNFFTTAGAIQTTNSGNYDVFVTKLDMSGTSSIAENTKSDWFTVYPNPSQGIYQLDFINTITQPLLIEVFDIEGKLINTQLVSNHKSVNLDISNEPAGIYVLKVIANHTQEAVRLVKL